MSEGGGEGTELTEFMGLGDITASSIGGTRYQVRSASILKTRTPLPGRVPPPPERGIQS